MNGTWLRMVLAGAVALSAIVAVAGPDTFWVGGSSDGSLTVAEEEVAQVNTYAQVTAISTDTQGRPVLDLGTSRLGSENLSFATNKLVLVLQATSPAAGPVPGSGTGQNTIDLELSSVGRWELARVSSYTTGTRRMVLTQPLKHAYEVLATQVILVPEYSNVTVEDDAVIEALPWNGVTGGVVALFSSGAINLNDTGRISASAKGFRGGVFTPEPPPEDGGTPADGCDADDDGPTDYRLGSKGEGLSAHVYDAGTTRGNANATTGGGGGACRQSGGGGGGNAGLGGMGGNARDRASGGASRDVGGLGGASLAYSPLTQLSLGGGGGSGQGVHATATTTPNGGAGGGIVFLRAASLNGGVVAASGGSAEASVVSGGGGGGGGTISLRLVGACVGTELHAEGGTGGAVQSSSSAAANAAGPGGGGGGGRIFFQSASSSSCPVSVAAGLAGMTANGGPSSPPIPQGALPIHPVQHSPPYVGTVGFLMGGMPNPIAVPTLSALASPIKTAYPQITGTGTPGGTVLIYRNHTASSQVQVLLARTVVGANGQFSVTVSLPANETSTLRAAHEVQGLQGSYSGPLTLRVDTLPPDTQASTSVTFPTRATSISFTIQGFEADGSPCNGTTTPSCSYECRLVTPSTPSPSFGACSSPRTFALSGSGTHRFEARAIDAAQNVDASPAIIEFVVDHDAPDVAILAANPTPPAARSRFTTAEFGFATTASDVVRFECELVRQPPFDPPTGWVTCPAHHGLTGLQNAAQYTLSVRAVDRAGNVSAAPATRSWVVDTTPPNTEFTGSALPTVTSENISFAFQGVGGDIARLECSLDSAEFTTCTSPYRPTTRPADGPHVFQVRAVDQAGNVDPTPAMHRWEVDTVPPPVTIVNKPSDPSNQATAGFDFDSTATDVVRFECLLEASPEPEPPLPSWQTCAASSLFPNLTHGTRYTLSVRAVDRALNETVTPATHAWTVDLVAPDTEFTGSPRPAVTRQNISFTFQGLGGDIARLECSLDAEAFRPCTSPYQPAVIPADGSHVFQVRAVDHAGNVDPTPATHSWEVDTQAPPVTIVTRPADPSNQTTAGFDFNSTATDVIRFECLLQAVPAHVPPLPGWQTCGASSLFPNLRNATRYTLSVRAVDRAGNQSDDFATYSWSVDTMAPDTVFTGSPRPAVTRENIAFTFQGVGGDIARLECSLDAEAFTTCTSPYQPETIPADGTHVFQVRAVDQAGNVDPTPATHSWEVDTTAPDTAISPTSPAPPRDPTNVTASPFGFTSTATDVAYFECRLNTVAPSTPTTGNWVRCPAAHVVSGGADGTRYQLQVRAVDRVGNTDATPASHAWLVDTTPPNTAFTAEVPNALTSLFNARFGFHAPGADDIDRFECSLDGGPFYTCASPHDLTVGDGDHTMLVRAVDRAGNVDQTPATHFWRVLSGPVRTFITKPTETLTNNPRMEFTFSSTKGNVEFFCRLNTEPERSCGTIDSERREVDWAIDVGEGDHTMNVQAVDLDNLDRDTVGETRYWTVDMTPPPAPLITNPASTYINTRAPAIEGTATEGGTVTVYDVDSVPPLALGSNVISITGLWRVDGVLLSEGSHTLGVTHRDGANNTSALEVSERRIIIVDTLPPETAVSVRPAARGRERTVHFEFQHLNEPNFATFECSLNGADFQNCPSPHQVTVAQDGSHSMRVRAKDLAGNVDPSPVVVEWAVDSIPPRTTIGTVPAEFSQSAASSFAFTAVDESDVVFECSLNDGGFVPCASPFVPTGLVQGVNRLAIRATDSVGNEEVTTPAAWTVDDTPPDLPVLESPEAGSTVETPTPQFRGVALGGAHEVFIHLDGFLLGKASVNASGEWRYTGTGNLSSGEHFVSVYAVDRALNASDPTTPSFFKIIPSTEIDSRGGGLSCTLGGSSGGTPLTALGLVAFALLAARRGRRP
ncbi:adventurous gliding motility protein AgmC [Myxococcus hansupus]|nr:Ig-like domain repeat protein [Myxococcus hansupus]